MKRDSRERFLNFEAFNGFVIFIPWGWGFVWYGLPSKEMLMQYSILHERFGYNYGMVSLGVVLMVWGCRKVFVNRIRQQVKEKALIAQCKVKV